MVIPCYTVPVISIQITRSAPPTSSKPRAARSPIIRNRSTNHQSFRTPCRGMIWDQNGPNVAGK